MPSKFAITGSRGLIGSAVCQWLTKRGHQVTPLIRPNTVVHGAPESVIWDPQNKVIDLESLEGHDVVIHLAGASIAGKKWTESYKKEIIDSRVKGTRFLSESLAKLKHPPKIFYSASAIGFYGDHPAKDLVDETSSRGFGFLADVTRQWEEATQSAEDAGILVTHMRLGVVLDTKGGALAKMLPPFKMGVGGPIGTGKQILSWIALWEIPQMIYYLTIRGGIRGPVNFTAPNPVTSFEFAKALGKVMRRPAVMPLPEFAVKIIFGEMGQELLLNGAYIVPRRLLDKGYNFSYPDLEKTLESILKSNSGSS